MISNPIEIDDNVLEHMSSLTLLCVEDDKSTQLLYEAIFEDYVVHRLRYVVFGFL